INFDLQPVDRGHARCGRPDGISDPPVHPRYVPTIGAVLDNRACLRTASRSSWIYGPERGLWTAMSRDRRTGGPTRRPSPKPQWLVTALPPHCGAPGEGL